MSSILPLFGVYMTSVMKLQGLFTAQARRFEAMRQTHSGLNHITDSLADL